MWPSLSGACASTTPHGSTIIERPPECCPAGCCADLVGGDHERLVLDRARPHERLPVVARRRQRERRRQRDHARPAHGEDPVELGEAQVVADRQPQLDAVGGLREHDLLARLLELGLAVGAPADLDVEHVHLAIHRPDLALRVDVHGGVGELLAGPATRSRIEPATRSTPSSRAIARAHAIAGAVERLGRRAQLLLGAHRRPLLGQHDQLRAVGRRRAREAIGDGHVRDLIGGGVELDCGDPQERIPPTRSTAPADVRGSFTAE